MILDRGSAGAAQFESRLKAYSEYAEALDQQASAAESGDLEAVAEFASVLDALERRLGGLPPVPGPQEGEPAEVTELRDRARETLEHAAATQRRLVEVLRDSRNETREALRELDGRERQVRSYLEGSRPEGRFNVRF